MTPMPEINTLKNATTPAARLYNWNILTAAFSMFNISIDPDTKSLIIAGDRDMLTEVLKQLYEAEHERSIKSSRSVRELKEMQDPDKPSKQQEPKEPGLLIESIDERKSLSESESCLEFLILSFVHNFSLKPKQGIGLLAQGCKYLAHIVAKGLKGDFDPVRLWLSEIYSETEKLSDLIIMEQKEDSLQFVMNALKPGFLSKDTEVVSWTFRLVSRLALDLNQVIDQIWRWFEDEGLLELCVIAIRRNGDGMLSNALDLWIQVGQGHYFDLFISYLQNQSKDKHEYFTFIASFLPYFMDSLAEEIFESGCITYWLDQSSQEFENQSSPSKTRTLSLTLVQTLFKSFFSHLSESQVNNLIASINRRCRDGQKLIEIQSISTLFDWLDFLAEKRSPIASTLYRTLTFLLVEVFHNVDLREFIVVNFSELFKKTNHIPIGVLAEPYVKKFQLNESAFEMFDFDFVIVLAQHPKLSVQHAIQLIDLMGKIYLNQLFFSKAAGVPFTYLASRFIEVSPMQDFLIIFAKHSLNLAMTTEHKVLGQSRLKKKDLSESLQQRNRIFDIVSWIAQQWQDELNTKLKKLILPLNFSYFLVSKQNCKGLFSILALLGNIEEMLQVYKEENPELFESFNKTEQIEEVNKNDEISQNDVKLLALVPVSGTSSKSSLPKRKAFFPWDRAASDIEKAKKRKMEKDQKARDEEEKKRKALDFKKKKIKQQLDVRKFEQGVGNQTSFNLVLSEGLAGKLIANNEEFALREVVEEDLIEGVKMILNKYSRVFKVVFQKYSGTGFARKAQNKSEFETHAERKERITDTEFIKIFKDYGVISKLCNKEELRMVMRAYNHKIAKQAEQNYVDYEGFKGVFCQLAYFIYSKKNLDYSHLPPVVSIKLLLDFMRESTRAKSQSTELFDEPDPGSGDKDVVRSLNKLLQKDPNTTMPEGYKRVQDRDLQVIFKVPKSLSIPKSYKVSIEILDSVLQTLGIHILEPQVKYFNLYRAKGVPTKEKEKEKGKVEDSASKEKIKPSVTLTSANTVKLSPTLKFCIAHASPQHKDVIEECASLLEDVLHSVQLKLTRVINRQPKSGAQEQKFEQKKELEKKEEEAKRLEEERKRKVRQQQLLEELNRAKEERAEKLRRDEERRKAEASAKESKKKENLDKVRKKKEEKAKMINEWAKKKEEDSKRAKEEEMRKKNEIEDQKKAEEVKKRIQERFEASLLEKKKKVQEVKEEEAKKALQAKEAQEKKKQLGMERLKESKQKELKSETKTNDQQFINNVQVKSLISTLSPNFDIIFTFYLNLSGKEMPDDASLPWLMFDKFCNQFEIYSIISQDQVLQIFKSFTKRRTNECLPFEDFKTLIAVLAWRTKDNFQTDDQVELLKQFLNKFEILMPANALKAKMKKMNPDSGKGTKRKIVKGTRGKAGVGKDQGKTEGEGLAGILKNQAEKMVEDEIKEDRKNNEDSPEYQKVPPKALPNTPPKPLQKSRSSSISSKKSKVKSRNSSQRSSPKNNPDD